MNAESLALWTPRAQALLRIVIAYLFLLHGSAKLLHVPHVAMFDNLQPMTLLWWAGVLELVGGVLLLIGWLTRPVAFVLAGEMAFAYFIGHASRGQPLLPMLNNGELAVTWCFVFLYFAAAGAGSWSVDAVRSAGASTRSASFR